MRKQITQLEKHFEVVQLNRTDQRQRGSLGVETGRPMSDTAARRIQCRNRPFSKADVPRFRPEVRNEAITDVEPQEVFLISGFSALKVADGNLTSVAYEYFATPRSKSA